MCNRIVWSIILYNSLVVISLQVTLEMAKFAQDVFINWYILGWDGGGGKERGD